MNADMLKDQELFAWAGEAEGLEELLRKWETLSGNLGKYPPRAPVLLPDLFVVSESDSMTSRLVRDLAAYLQNAGNLMEFYGDTPYFEFMLGYCEPEQTFTEIRRFMAEISENAGFRNLYKGIIHLKLDAWVGHQEEQHFLDFMDYLAENTRSWLLILSVESEQNGQLGAFEAVLSMFLRIEKLMLRMASADSYTQELDEMIRRYGFELDESARGLLTQSIELLRQNRFFDASYTMSLLCSDIVYEVYSHELRTSSVLTAAQLASFGPDSEYIRRTLKKLHESRAIGFTR